MLPKIDVPTYELKLVSQKKPIKFRPFLVKEQKLLMMAQENSENDKDYLLNTVKQIINNCVLTELNVNDLPMFDIEYLFLNLRARSMGEVVKISYKCVNRVGEHQCGNVVNFDVNILNIKPTISKEHNNRVEINEKLGLLMKYPSLDILKEIDMNNEESVLRIIFSCIESIYDSETLYHTKDIEAKELEEFVDSLPTTVVEKIKMFFDTMPKIEHDIHFHCNKCNYEEDIKIEGLNSFFE
jgi:DNA polymerase III gamma/tau subunit